MSAVVENLRKKLHENSDEKFRGVSEGFFKEEVKVIGVRSNIANRLGKEAYREIKSLPKPEIFSLCEELWISGFLEESIIAADWAYALHRNFTPSDFPLFERWVGSYVSNWASCDTFCNHTMGEFIEMYPEFISELKRWALSDNRWMRRAAAVSLIIPAKKGLFLADIFEIAELLLTDSDDMVRKGYGWLLKEASRKQTQKVYDYVVSRCDVMPRTAFRYAIELMPADMRKRAMSIKPHSAKAPAN